MDSIPNRVPTHFGLTKPDAWGDKTGLIGLTIVMFAFYLVFSLVNIIIFMIIKFNKITDNLKKLQAKEISNLFRWIKLEVVLDFLYIGYISIQVALNSADSLSILFLPVLLLTVVTTIVIYGVRIARLKE